MVNKRDGKPEPKDEPKPKPTAKKTPKCGQCMDKGIIVTTYITDEGTVGSHIRECSH